TVSCCPLTEGDCNCYPTKDNCECEPPKKVSSEGVCCDENWTFVTDIDCMSDGLCYFENDGCPICVPCETETTDSELTETTSSEPDDDDDTETTETDTEGCYPACGEGESCCGGECIPTPTCDEKNCMGLTEDGCACESKKSTHATGYCCDETEECCSLNGGCERCVPANDCDACYCADVKAYRCGTDLVSMTFCCNPSMHEGGCHWPGCQEGDLVLANLEDCEEENQGGLGFEEPENTVTDTEWEDICQPAPHGCSELKSYGGRITREYYCKEDEECCGTEICCPKWMECIEGKRCECPEGEILMEDGTCQKCVEGYDAYCTKFGSTVAGEDLCFDVSCSSNTLRTCEVQKIDNVFACCPEGEQAFCLKYDEKYDEKYDCIEASCCVGQRFPQSTYEDGRPKQDSCCDSSKVVQALTIDGSTKVPDGGIVNACVSSGETAFCLGYDENGKCTGVGVNSNTCTPYVDEYYENGKPKAGSCCSSMPYIYTTYDDGTPKTRRCCADGKKVIPIKVSATENASDGGYVNACVDSGETAYCSSYDEKGKCTSKSSSSSACTPYVSAYYENGNPKSGGCCDISSKKLTAFDAPNGGKVGVCHDSSRTAYCYSYDENGKCTYAASSPSACTPYVSEYYENGKPKSGRCGTVGCTPYVGKTYDDGTPKTGSCCASGSTVQAVTIDGTTKVPNGGYVNWCVNSGYTAYCATYDENGKCSGVYTSSSACTPYRYDSLTGRCCNTSSGLEMEKIEEKTWCRYKEGQCSASKKHAFNGDTGICCGRSSNIVSVASGVDMCVSDGYSAYCKDVDEDGVCVEAGVCEPSKIVTTFGILGICHKTSEKGLCTRYSKKGKCLDVGTCNGTPYIYSTYDDGTSRKEECCSAGSNLIMPVEINEKDYAPDGGIVKYCVSSGSTAFCSSYDENGKCTTVGTSSTACTPYVSEYWEKGKPKKGNCCSGTPYVHSSYDDGTPKTRGCCADGKKVIPIKVS
ncbi:MAG: hypothetical protein J6U64_00405, partial [Alphaproteobacteria bacterium]|nr:hypothetical protein [Alphaproteobacteria bacterium]